MLFRINIKKGCFAKFLLGRILPLACFSVIVNAQTNLDGLRNAQNKLPGDTAAVDSGAVGAVAIPVLEKIETSTRRKTHQIVLKFKNGVPKILDTLKSINQNSRLTLYLPNTTGEISALPELNISLGYWDFSNKNAGIEISLYFPKIPFYKILKKESQIDIRITRMAGEDEGIAEFLKSVEYVNPDKNILLVKYEFTNLPEEKIIYLTEDKKTLVALFHNVGLEANGVPDPDASLISKSEFHSGLVVEEGDSLSYVHFTYTSKRQINFDIREDVSRVFIDIVPATEVEDTPVRDLHIPQDSNVAVISPNKKVTTQGNSADDPEPNVTGTIDNMLVKKKRRGWIYTGVASTALIGGAVGAWWYLQGQDDGSGGDTGEFKVNGIDEEIILPDPAD